MATGNETTGYKMNDEDDFSLIRDSVSVRHGQYFLFVSVLFFQFVNWLVKLYGPPKSLTDDGWKFRNLFVSWVHSVIASVWIITSTVLYPELYTNLMQHITHMTFYCVCFSTGYFLYDFLDLLINNPFRSVWELAMHHVALAGMFYYNIHTKAQIAFNIVALTVEVNSVFLHWRKMLQMLRTPYNSSKYILIKYLNLISFTIFRGVPLVTISTGCFLYRHKVSTIYFLSISITTFIMDVLNVILFWRIIKSDILRSKPVGNRRSVYSTVKQGDVAQENDTNNHVLSANNNSTDGIKSRTRSQV